MGVVLPLLPVVLIVVVLAYFARKGRLAREREQRQRIQNQAPRQVQPVNLNPANATIRCPFCSEPVLASAKKCKHCGEFIQPRIDEDAGYLPPEVGENLPPMVRTEVKKLSRDKMAYFLDEFQRKSKITSTAYICWLFGLHYAYMERWGTLIIFWLTLWGCGFWWLADAFRMGSLVRDCNRDVAAKAFREMKIMSI